jgi:hypothetical protein
MPKFATWDIAIAGALFVVTTLSTLLWIQFGNLDRFAKLPTVSRTSIVFRLAVVFSGLVLICYWQDISVLMPVAALFGFLALGWCLSELTPIAFWNPAIIVLYVLQQYVLGFPDRDDWILPSPGSDSNGGPNMHLQQQVGSQGRTCSVIKPTGFADINGVRFDVISERGCLIESESAIVVSSVNGNRLVVRVLNNDEESREIH